MTWRGLLFQGAFVVWTTLLSLLLLPLAPVIGGHGIRWWARRWEGGILVLLRVLCGIRLEVRGAAPTEPSLLASKHQSALETVVFHRLVPEIAVPLKVELTRIPLFGRLLLKSGCIGVQREAGTRALRQLVNGGRRRLDEGLSLLIFPEGTRVPPGERRPYHPGVAALYLQLGRPVVPVALHTGHVWGRGSFAKHPGTAVIEFLEPIQPGLDRRTFMAHLEERIETASARLAGVQPSLVSDRSGTTP